VYPLRLKSHRDLALLRLERPVANVSPRPIAIDDGLVERATSYRAVGFGATDRDATIKPRHKREASITAASNGCTGSTNGQSDESAYGCKPNEEIVAGHLRDRTDTCNGDSGGPLYISSRGTGEVTPSSEYRLAGVTSRASSLSQTMCGDGGVYERLDRGARDWITATVNAWRVPQ
jgi:hypothetical protein